MMSLPFGLFTQVSGSGPLDPLVRISTVFWDYHAFKTYFVYITVSTRGLCVQTSKAT